MGEQTSCVYCGREIKYDIKLFKEGAHGEPMCEDSTCVDEWKLGITSDDDVNNTEGGEV
ncbi:hypothetical protein [Alteribacter populi]|uniref:hypothetical protein n=1 Tax=Alteribacter populi TaxID=2011011 RepID=UPI0018E29DAE|nr:hypothetical protein [Alteribacter populi]